MNQAHYGAVLAAAWLLLLPGCATHGGFNSEADVSLPAHCGTDRLDNETELQLNVVRDMIAEGRLYGALAHLDAIPARYESARVLRALALRRIGSPEAASVYQGLLRGCYAGEAYHGLGQIAVREGDLELARTRLVEAVRRLPLDANVRNDLGTVEMRLGNAERARYEFLTAIELSSAPDLPVDNLLTLLLARGERQQADALVRHYGISQGRVSDAMARARDLGTSLSRPTSSTIEAGKPSSGADAASPGR